MNKGKEKRQPIKVFLRVRPINEIEKLRASPTIVDCSNNKEVVVCERPGDKISKKFVFDRVFSPSSSQIDVYKSVASPLIREVLDGYNCTIFAYGQTGTGKTYTMEGKRASQSVSWTVDPHSGIIPRALSHLFDELRLLEAEFSVKASYLELYNEELIDLLSPVDDNNKIRLFEDATKKGAIIVNGLEEATVKNKDEVYTILEKGSKKRQTASTLMNAVSSRSHTVFSITVRIKESRVEDGEEVLRTGKLNLVDLAGSENIGRSGAVDKRAREAGNINQSLLTLGRVITALVERTPHIPYRESKLTRLLQESLGGRTKTCIIATVSPSYCNAEETLSTLDYAHRAKNIQNKPEINQKIGKVALIKEYIDEIDRLKADLIATREKSGVFLAEDNYRMLMDQLQVQKREITDLLQDNKTLTEASEKKDELNSQLSESLQKYEDDLQETKSKLKETKIERDKKIFLLNHHIETEKQLSQQAETLMAVADTATNDVVLLHNTLGRKRNLEERNLTVCHSFVENLKEKMSNLSSLSSNFQDSRIMKHENLLKKLQLGSSSSKKYHDESLNLLNSAKTSQCELIKRISGFSDQSVKSSQSHVRNIEEKFTKFCNIDSEYLQSFLNDVIGKMNEISNLNMEYYRYHQEFVEDVTKKLQEQEDEIGNFISQTRNTLNLLSSGMEKQENTLKRVNNMAHEVEQMQSRMEKQAIESLMTFQRDLQAEMKKIYAQTGDLKTCLTEVDLTSMNSQVSSIDASIAKTHINIDTKKGNISQLVCELDRKTTSTVNAVQAVTSLNCETFTKQKVSVLENQRQRLTETSECLQDLSQGLIAHNTLIQTNAEELHVNVNKFSEAQESSLEHHLCTDLQFIEVCKEDIAEETSSVNNYCNNTIDNICECGHAITNLANEIMKDTPSGHTPQRRDFKYPRSLVSTSPHERILSRFRPVEEDVVLEDPEFSDHSSESQEVQTEDDATASVSSSQVNLEKYKSRSEANILDDSTEHPSGSNNLPCTSVPNIPFSIDKENTSPIKHTSSEKLQMFRKQILRDHNE